MLSKVNTAKSECSRDSDRERIFAAVRGLAGGFTGLDRSVLHTMTEWLQLQLEQEMAQAVADGREDVECKMTALWEGCSRIRAKTAACCRFLRSAWPRSAFLATTTPDHVKAAAMHALATRCLGFDFECRLTAHVRPS
jgi:hypothetical protein